MYIQRKLEFNPKLIELIWTLDITSVGLADAAERVCGSDRPNNDAWNAIRKKSASERPGANETESKKCFRFNMGLGSSDSLRWK